MGGFLRDYFGGGERKLQKDATEQSARQAGTADRVACATIVMTTSLSHLILFSVALYCNTTRIAYSRIKTNNLLIVIFRNIKRPYMKSLFLLTTASISSRELLQSLFV
jgi:hypothetical protein